MTTSAGELIPMPALTRGDHGRDVLRAQEWLALHGLGLELDGRFGYATEGAVRSFQDAQGIAPSGEITPATAVALLAPLTRAAAPTPPRYDLRSMMLAVATQHAAETPREVGGPNCGPWVRYYMDGHSGRAWPWCAGFVSAVLAQAGADQGVEPPIPGSFSCDLLASQAKEAGRFIGGQNKVPLEVAPGDLFLIRRNPGDWTHTGVVLAMTADHFETIEGNTDREGRREGTAVFRRFRSYTGKDFIRVQV